MKLCVTEQHASVGEIGKHEFLKIMFVNVQYTLGQIFGFTCKQQNHSLVTNKYNIHF